MSERNDGGPAFPKPISTDEATEPCNVDYGQPGMSLRDYFAAKAMQVLMQMDPRKETDRLSAPHGREWTEWIASDAYDMADAMLAEREREN